MIETGFFDLDRTTVDESGCIYEGLSTALNARPRFTKTVLTARGYPRYIEAVSENPSLLASPSMPVALENGARIIDGETHDNIYYCPLSIDEQTAICDYIGTLEGLKYVAFHPEAPRSKTLLWSPDNAEAARLYDAYSHNADVFTGSKEALFQTIIESNPCMITCRTYENEHCDLPNITFYSRGTTVNFMPDGPNKGTALQIIATMKDVNLSRTMVAGNDHNDVPMLTIEGLAYPVAVGKDLNDSAKICLPEHTIYIPDQRKLGDFVLRKVQK